MHQREKCGSCGTFPEDWQDPVTKRKLKRPRYVADTFHCFGCDEKEKLRKSISKQKDAPEGVYVYLRYYDPKRD